LAKEKDEHQLFRSEGYQLMILAESCRRRRQEKNQHHIRVIGKENHCQSFQAGLWGEGDLVYGKLF